MQTNLQLRHRLESENLTASNLDKAVTPRMNIEYGIEIPLIRVLVAARDAQIFSEVVVERCASLALVQRLSRLKRNEVRDIPQATTTYHMLGDEVEPYIGMHRLCDRDRGG
ncbi:hypothetical protein WT33_24135 [Burkholderia stagnalis]|nr:hypothetical protein WT33_24135 [Burkholderia stagnalis]